jgi:hypothetical protein
VGRHDRRDNVHTHRTKRIDGLWRRQLCGLRLATNAEWRALAGDSYSRHAKYAVTFRRTAIGVYRHNVHRCGCDDIDENYHHANDSHENRNHADLDAHGRNRASNSGTKRDSYGRSFDPRSVRGNP